MQISHGVQGPSLERATGNTKHDYINNSTIIQKKYKYFKIKLVKMFALIVILIGVEVYYMMFYWWISATSISCVILYHFGLEKPNNDVLFCISCDTE